MRSIFARGKGQGARGLTVRVSEPALAHDGAMPHAPCKKVLYGPQSLRLIVSRFNRLTMLLLLALLLCGAAIAGSSDQHRLDEGAFAIFYAPEDANTAQVIAGLLRHHGPRLETFFGLKIPGTARIVIARSREEFRAFGGEGLPEWAAAVYLPAQKTVLVKNPTWAGSLASLENDLVHELSHLFIDIKFSAFPLPLWYNEGLAKYLSGEQLDMIRSLTLSNAAYTGHLVPLDQIEQLIRFHRVKAELAYIESLSALLFFKEMIGGEAQWRQFHNLAATKGWEAALQESRDIDGYYFEAMWIQHIEEEYRWMVVLNLDNLIWISLVLVLLLGFALSRLRNRRKVRRWEREEEDAFSDTSGMVE